MPASVNYHAARKENKGRRRENESNNRKVTGHSKTLNSQFGNVAVVLPPGHSKLPSPSTPSPMPQVVAVPLLAPTAISQPTVVLVTAPSQQTALKDVVPKVGKEGKGNRRKVLPEKAEEKPPLKTTIRKKKGSNSTSLDIKTASEKNDARRSKKNKRSPHTSSESPKRKSAENKSEGSKEPSDLDKAKSGPKTFNKEAAQKYFKQMIASQRARKRSDDSRLEKMPESSQLNSSVRTFKKKGKRAPKTPLSTELFKENGDPVWVIDENDNNNSTEETNEDGTKVKNAYVAMVMAEDGYMLDDTAYCELAEKNFMEPPAPLLNLPPDLEFDPFAPMDVLEDHCQYLTREIVVNCTLRTLLQFSMTAIKRISGQMDGDDAEERPRRRPGDQHKNTSSESTTPPPKTMNFQLTEIIQLSYDRKHPIASIQKFRNKYGGTINLSREQTTQMGSKEVS